MNTCRYVILFENMSMHNQTSFTNIHTNMQDVKKCIGLEYTVIANAARSKIVENCFVRLHIIQSTMKLLYMYKMM